MKPIDNLIRANIKIIKPYASARDEYKSTSDDLVFLDANENPFDNGVNRYPDPQQSELKSTLSDIKNIPSECMLLGNGSDEVLDLIFRVFCEPNTDNVITLPPTYGMYEVLANMNAIELLKVPLNDQFQPNINAILNAINSRTKLIFLCTPNNPTANSFTSKSIERVLRDFEGIVVIDEAYIDFTEKKSWSNRLDEFPNLIVIQTLSKAYGLAGIRLGICYASSYIISVINKIKPPYNINKLTQQKALECLLDQKRLSLEIKEILNQRSRLLQVLEHITFVDVVYPSDANFILVKVDDATKRYNQLIANGIVVRNRTNLPGCYNCLRLTIGSEMENSKLISILKQIQ
ncbi:histidinol-phosphate transaminase [uncultured Psychroserpens sp.]|uniref:histidinol-phosphate transaminase n=1 Tax=uncultured Psychroserpens sp. TaxID=255436 RepID=UPI002631F943|nr:histidinol-phosphate transaminase [uncultured Psychroserpens sp.]